MDTAYPSSDTAPAASLPSWRLPTRIAFRFFALYFFLYVLTTQMLFGLLFVPPPDAVSSPGSSQSTWTPWSASSRS